MLARSKDSAVHWQIDWLMQTKLVGYGSIGCHLNINEGILSSMSSQQLSHRKGGNAGPKELASSPEETKALMTQLNRLAGARKWEQHVQAMAAGSSIQFDEHMVLTTPYLIMQGRGRVLELFMWIKWLVGTFVIEPQTLESSPSPSMSEDVPEAAMLRVTGTVHWLPHRPWYFPVLPKDVSFHDVIVCLSFSMEEEATSHNLVTHLSVSGRDQYHLPHALRLFIGYLVVMALAVFTFVYNQTIAWCHWGMQLAAYLASSSLAAVCWAAHSLVTNLPLLTWPNAACEQLEDADKLLIVADVPGMNADDLQVEFLPVQRCVRIKGQRQLHPRNSHSSSSAHTSRLKIDRSIRLPDKALIDGIKAHVGDGVLTVEVPKAKQPERRRIAVQRLIEGSSSSSSS